MALLPRGVSLKLRRTLRPIPPISSFLRKSNSEQGKTAHQIVQKPLIDRQRHSHNGILIKKNWGSRAYVPRAWREGAENKTAAVRKRKVRTTGESTAMVALISLLLLPIDFRMPFSSGKKETNDHKLNKANDNNLEETTMNHLYVKKKSWVIYIFIPHVNVISKAYYLFLISLKIYLQIIFNVQIYKFFNSLTCKMTKLFLKVHDVCF